MCSVHVKNKYRLPQVRHMTGETRRGDQQPSGQHGNSGAKTRTETEELKLNENVYIQSQHI